MLSTGKIIFAVGICIIILSVIAAPVCLKLLRKAEKDVSESIWEDYR